MKNQKLKLNKVLGLILLGSLAACGSDEPEDPYYNNQNIDPRYQNLAAQCGGNNLDIGNMPYKQTTRGEDPSGAILDLMIYGTGNGEVGALGELFIPDLSVFGVGLRGKFRGCVSSQGITGFLDPSSGMADLQINLVGPKVNLTPSGPRTPTVENQVINGQFNLIFNGRTIPMFF